MTRLYFVAVRLLSAEISGERMRAHVKYLASDQLEGRGVGTRGEKLATEYIAAQFDSAGAKPAGENGTFFQRVPMVGLGRNRARRSRPRRIINRSRFDGWTITWA